jgi:hypothetical protein
MAEDQDTKTGAAIYPAFVQHANDPRQISAKDQHAPGQVPEWIAQDQPTGGDQKNRH